MIRVLVVDGSILMRKAIAEALDVPGEICVAGAGRDGREAIALAGELKPDVIAMGTGTSGTDSVAALRAIMREQPTPVVLLPGAARDGAGPTIEALAAGAVDFVPGLAGPLPLAGERARGALVEKVRIASRVNRGRLRPAAGLPERPKAPAKAVAAERMVVVGASVGGPYALERVMAGLPGDTPAGVLIVQHLPSGYTRPLARRLDRIAPMDVREARDGDAVLAGRALVAPGGYHAIVGRGAGPGRVVSLSREPPVRGARPAVDVAMKSAARAFGAGTVGVVLTGAGNDGAIGLRYIRERGGRTIACDEGTSLLFGMPAAAIRSGCVDRVAPLEEIAGVVTSMLQEQ